MCGNRGGSAWQRTILGLVELATAQTTITNSTAPIKHSHQMLMIDLFRQTNRQHTTHNTQMDVQYPAVDVCCARRLGS